MRTIEELRKIAELIKNETKAGANNAQRIGGAFETVADVVESIGDNHGYVSTGEDAYKVAVKNGYEGTVEDWLKSLKGDKGDALYFDMLKPEEIAVIAEQLSPKQLAYICEHLSDEQLAAVGSHINISDEQLSILATKLSPEQLALMKGDKGDAFKYEDFTPEQLEGLKGAKGDKGKSAYEVAKDNGFVGSETEWLASLKGVQGDDAYKVAVANGFDGTKEAWLASLKGAKGDPFSFADFTPQQKADFAKPALEAVQNAKKEVDGRLRVVDHGTSDTTFELTPNVLHKWEEITELNLTLGAPAGGDVLSEYCFQFTCPSGQATQLTLPVNLVWQDGLVIIPETGLTYQGLVVNGLISMFGFK